MHRFYHAELPKPDKPSDIPLAGSALSDCSQPVKLDKEQSHHLRRVLRLAPGDTIELLDGNGAVARGVIEDCHDQATVRISEVVLVPPARPTLDLAVCMPKGPRADDMVNQLSQLGVDRLIPLLTQRSVVKPGPGRLDRFRRAAIVSVKQCGRPYLMHIDSPAPVADLLGGDYDLKLIADPAAEPVTDTPIRVGKAGRILVLIGPEGGWTESESEAAAQSGCIGWSFATHVLRIETAATAAAAIVRHLTHQPD